MKHREPIAVLAMACRMPGGRNTPEDFWAGLLEGYRPVRGLSDERRRLGLDDAGIPGGVRAAFLEDIERFDAAFFGISPREASHMDPQHRLFLEVAFDALERAGQRADLLAGSRTGVFMGIYSNEYAWLPASAASHIDLHSASGAGPGIAPNRLSYVLDLRGPSLAVDTTCSSSLVAAHLAVQSLRSGECDLAVVGGASLILSSDVMQSVAQSIPLAADGRCKTFSALADGTVRGEGCIVLVFKRLADALSDHDPIEAVILGSAVNQDGRSNGLMAPNPQAQRQLIEDALQDAGVSASQMVYLEAHGTATQLGDTIELEAALAVLGSPVRAQGPCAIGSVKGNVGHLEAAAGAAGLMRTVLSLRHGRHAPHPLVGEPHALLQESPQVLKIFTRPEPLADRPEAVVGVSAFSLGGTNAHLVLGKAPPRSQESPLLEDRPPAARPFLFPVSARSREALRMRLRQLQEYIEREAPNEAVLAYTLCERRSRHPYRQTLVARTREELQRELHYVLSAPASPGSAPLSPRAAARVTFIFSGHGCQWANMGRTLLATEPVFRQAIERLDAIVSSAASWSLLDLLSNGTDDSAVISSTRGQPALLAVQLALAELLGSWGIKPAAVMGYSAGEVTAMVLAGMISEADAMRACLRRGQALEALFSGGMLAVRLNEEATTLAMRRVGGSLALAAVTGPETAIVSGPAADLARLQRDLESRDVLCIDTGVPYLFHHPAARAFPLGMQDDTVARNLEQPRIPVYSSVLGRRVARAAEMEGDYWIRALCDTLRFADAVASALGDGLCNFVEISPSPALTTDVRDIIRAHGVPGRAVPTLRRYGDAQSHLAATAAALFEAGYPIHFKYFLGEGRQSCALPDYPWEDQRFWWPTARSEPEPRVIPGADNVYALSWRESPLPERVAAEPPVLSNLQTRCEQLSRDSALEAYSAVEQKINSACALFAASAVRSLIVGSERFTVSSLIEQWQIDCARGRLLQRLCELLAEDGYLKHESGQWVASRELPNVDPSDDLRRLAAEQPLIATELLLLARCGPRIGEVLRDLVDPLTLLFPDSSIDAAAALFGETGIARVMNTLAGDALEAVLASPPSSRPLRVLEIGAGTGGTTGALRRVLADRNVTYCYTDVSRTLLRFGARRFADWPALATRTLDIARDPLEQGFEAESFDVIVAANVLHATPRLLESLKHIRALLAPGGALLLIEATRAQRIIDLTFGLTQDWWSFEDTDLRAQHPLLEVSAWQEALVSSGFAEIAVVPQDRALADRLETSLLVCRRIRSDRARERRWRVLGEACEVETALDALLRAHGVPLSERDGVIDLRALAFSATESWSAGRLMNAQQRWHEDLLAFIKSTPPGSRLVFVTQNAVAVPGGGAVVDPLQASFCGTLAALAAEHPQFQPLIIDSEDAAPEILARRIWAEVQASQDSTRVVYRGGKRFTPMLTRISQSARDLSRIDSQKRYLITGGLGAVGFEIAEWLASRGARHLILAQRTATAPDRLARRLRVLEEAGVRVEIRSVDLARRDEAAAFALEMARGSPHLGGVIHAAGVFDDCLLAQQDWPRFERVLAPKVVGAWELHRALAEVDLDFFVLFSSAAELLNPVGVANYVAANAFLEGLAQRRRALGLAATCIAWGGWADVGMAEKMSDAWERRWTQRGLRALDTRRSFEMLARVIAEGPAVVFAMNVHWPLFAASASAHQRAMLAELLSLDGANNGAGAKRAAVGTGGAGAQQRKAGVGSATPLLAAGAVGPARTFEANIAANGAAVKQFAEPAAAVGRITEPGVPVEQFAESGAAVERLTEPGAARAKIIRSPPGDRRAMVHSLVRKHALDVLQWSQSTPVDGDLPLADIGFDSLMSLELRDVLARELDIPLPATLLFDHPTLNELSAFLASEAPAGGRVH